MLLILITAVFIFSCSVSNEKLKEKFEAAVTAETYDIEELKSMIDTGLQRFGGEWGLFPQHMLIRHDRVDIYSELLPLVDARLPGSRRRKGRGGALYPNRPV